jgi:hypothetical protein
MGQGTVKWFNGDKGLRLHRGRWWPGRVRALQRDHRRRLSQPVRKSRRSSSTSPKAKGAPGGKRQVDRLTHRQGTTRAPRQMAPGLDNGCTAKGRRPQSHQVRLPGHGLRKEISSDSAMTPASTASQSLAKPLASLPQELKRVGEGAVRSGALWISLVLFDQVCLKGRSDFVGRLERLIDGPLPRDVVHHAAIIPRGRRRLRWPDQELSRRRPAPVEPHVLSPEAPAAVAVRVRLGGGRQEVMAAEAPGANLARSGLFPASRRSKVTEPATGGVRRHELPSHTGRWPPHRVAGSWSGTGRPGSASRAAGPGRAWLGPVSS